METLRSGRFFGDEVLDACLNGTPIVRGGGDPKTSVQRIQQSLNDIGVLPLLKDIDGVFGPLTEANVQSYKQTRTLPPPDNVVDSAMMSKLDDNFAMDLFRQKAARLNADSNVPDEFKPGSPKVKVGGRVDHAPGYATCEFEFGTCVELAGSSVWFLPPVVFAAWREAGEVEGAFGVPIDDPWKLDATHAAQEFQNITYLFNIPGTVPFAVPRSFWLASRSGTGPIGIPKGPVDDFSKDVRIVEHDHGVVMCQNGLMPQALPDRVFAEWKQRIADQNPLGAPTTLASLAENGEDRYFYFQNDRLRIDKDGTSSRDKRTSHESPGGAPSAETNGVNHITVSKPR